MLSRRGLPAGQRVVTDGEGQCPLLLRFLSLTVTPETCSIHLPVEHDVLHPVRSSDLQYQLLSCRWQFGHAEERHV